MLPRTRRGGLVQPMPGPRDLAHAASHAPGIDGMKQDSEIGVARAAGHARYFVGFLFQGRRLRMSVGPKRFS